MVTEMGIPAAIGTAHDAPLGRGQGAHREQEAMRLDADLLRLASDVGLAGSMLFEWADEWFKFTWNTITHQVPAGRRQLWHDALTNEQWFGLVALDPTGAANPHSRRLAVPSGRGGPVTTASARVDEGYLYLDLRLRRPDTGQVTVALDPVASVTGSPGPGSDDTRADLVLTLDLATRTGQEWVRQEVDPLAPDGIDPGDRPQPHDGWVPLRLLTNRTQVTPTTGLRRPAELAEVGRLVYGAWKPGTTGYDSRAVWRVEGAVLRVRLPWAMAGMADPSSRRALLPSAPDHSVATTGIGLSLTAGGSTTTLGTVTWQGWERTGYRMRLKAGAAAVRDAFAAV